MSVHASEMFDLLKHSASTIVNAADCSVQVYGFSTVSTYIRVSTAMVTYKPVKKVTEGKYTCVRRPK